MNVRLFTDGGSRSGIGSAACIIDRDGKRERHCTFLGSATNNEAEIYALLLGLEILQGTKAPIEWFADSEYTLKSATIYIHNWKKNGWKTAAKDPVKNQGLWKRYITLVSGLTLKPNHVRGHTGHPENEECDSACEWMIETRGSITSGVGGPDESWVLHSSEELLNSLRNGASDTNEPKAVQPSFFGEETSGEGKSGESPLQAALKKAYTIAHRSGEHEIAATLKLLLSHQSVSR